MSRLFITPRELDFISDVTKEIVKDVIGQVIYYYSVSETKSRVHDIYLESPEKVFENPCQLDALVEFIPKENRTNEFGSEEFYTTKAWVHVRDLLDKGIQLSEGDFFSYGDIFFEITKYTPESTVYGEVEHLVGYIIEAKQSRRTQFEAKIFGPTAEKYSDADAQQNTFVQQRGFSNNRLGPTGDVRDLEKRGVTDRPISGPDEVSPRGSTTGAGSAFYGDTE